MLDKKYDFKSVEAGKYDKWIKNKYFEAGDKSKEPFTIVIPPPNITGNLHLGHAWDTTLQDIIIRYKKMCGYDTLWLPGMDHAAIATESKVVNKLKREGKSKSDLTREEFLKECWLWKNEHADNIRKQWAKLGLGLDYTRERFTLDEGLNKAVNYVFVDLYNKGLIYRGKKIINWDPIAMTALSNEEVIYKEEDSFLYYLKYKIEDSEEFLLVATTRPETIFGDTAVAVNPKDEKYSSLIGKKVVVPLVNRAVPVISDDAVLLDFGTGALKITPAHALEDFEIGQRHDLEIIDSINPNGTLNEVTGKYNGLGILEAREEILNDLKASDLLEKKEKYTHTIGYSERTNALVESKLSEQWFVKMESLVKNLLDNQKTDDKINFIPARFEKVLNHWLEDCRDWCISRQLYWGHRIPVWYKNDEVYVGMTAPKEEGWTQDNDVLDTWFSSALWPFSTLGWPDKTEDLERYFPGDVLVTGYDIIFFWVARMAFSSVEQMKTSPFKYCLIHGLIRDKEGRKMSKSLGNGIDPMEMIDLYGCDSLRFYLSTSTAPGMDLRFDEEKLKSTWNFINKLWNASRFVLMNLEDFKESDVSLENLSLEDKWILTKLNKTIKSVKKNMDKFLFNTAGSELYDFIWNVFCDWYIELSKHNMDKIATKSVLYITLKSILKMINPFMPFVTDEIYNMLDSNSIVTSKYPEYDKKYIFETEEKSMDEVIENITNIRNFKANNGITKNSQIIIKDVDKNLKQIFINMLKADDSIKVQFGNEKKYESKMISITFITPNSGDDDNLKLQLEEEKLKLTNSIQKRKKLLSNENYTNKAPKSVVDLDKEKLADEEEKLKIIIERLKAF